MMESRSAENRGDTRPRVRIGDAPLSIDDVVRLARGEAAPHLGTPVLERMRCSAAVLERLHEDGHAIYGVTTSVGASVGTQVPADRASDLSLNVLRMHGCGTGRILDDEEAAAVLAVRLSSLACGKSGVRPELAELMATLLTERVLPCIPSEGSVGASGDLTPLSYVAAVLAGEREVRHRGDVLPARQGLRRLGRAPLELRPKEALALMNGTSVAAAIGCLAWFRARRLARLSSALTAMASAAVRGNPGHFDAFIHEAKPHPGQRRVARWIREDLGGTERDEPPARLQDRYSIRCAPHVIGVLVDALAWCRRIVETEINGVSDNPVIDVESERVLHGGNFYGGHVGFAFDSLKVAVANVACLLDRQLMLLCNPAENGGLPADLVGVAGSDKCTHNGFKAVTIATSALAAEALKLTVPASAFSRSTELHNQDKVPMATIAARDLLRIVELTEQASAMMVLACCQAIDLREGEVKSERAASVHAAVRKAVPRLGPDRRMDVDVAAVLELLRSDALPLGDQELP